MNLEGVRVTSKIFKGSGFYVVPGRDYDPGNGKAELQKKLYVRVMFNHEIFLEFCLIL